MRRVIFEHLLAGPKPVGRLAETLPVSRPAVSQHLKVLKDSALVTARADGNRQVSRRTGGDRGVARVPRPNVGPGAGRFRRGSGAAVRTDEGIEAMSQQVQAKPVVSRTITVAATQERAFQVFAEGIAAGG
jgi:DNA-binding transcriptional ArsR family regulator